MKQDRVQKRKEAGDLFMKSNKNSIGNSVNELPPMRRAAPPPNRVVYSNPDLTQAYNDVMGYGRPTAIPDRDPYVNNYPSILNDYNYGPYKPISYNSNDLNKGYLNPVYNSNDFNRGYPNSSYNFGNNNNNNNPLYENDLISSRFVNDLNSRNAPSQFNSNSFGSRGGVGVGGGGGGGPIRNRRDDFNDDFASLNMNTNRGGAPVAPPQPRKGYKSMAKKINPDLDNMNAKDARTRVY
jgi:hypothetical protein